MLEIERKILGINVRDLCKKIENLGASGKLKVKKTFEGLVRINYFDFDNGRIRAKKDLLRVREFVPMPQALPPLKNTIVDAHQTLTYTELVYKTYGGIKDGSKVFDECEIGIPQSLAKMTGDTTAETLKLFLEKLGLKRVVYYEKKRTHYDCGSFKCEIDEHPKVEPFVEIEAQSAVEIDHAIEVLELKGFEQTPETISELLERKYKPLTLSDLIF